MKRHPLIAAGAWSIRIRGPGIIPTRIRPGSGTFPTIATGNPTLTIAALALRAADKILTRENRA